MFIKNLYRKYFKLVLLTAMLFLSSQHMKGQNNLDHYFKALAFEKYNNFSQAESEYLSAINSDNDNYYLKIALGRFYYKESLFSKAKIQFISSEKIKSNSASLDLAKIYSVEQNTDSAIFYLKKYLGYYKKIPQNLIKNDDAFGNIQYQKKWIELWEENHYSKPLQMIQEAEYSFNYSNTSEALTQTNLIIKTYKKFAPAYFLKAKILVRGKNFKDALKYFDKAISLNSRIPEYYLERARCYVFLKKYSSAIEDFQTYMKQNQYDIEVYKEISNAYALNKEYEKSLEAIRFYVKYFNKDYDALFQMAEINYDAGNYLNTIRIMNNLFDEQKPSSKYFNLRALAYMNANSYDLAYHDFSQCLDLDPTLTDSYYYRGIVNLKMNKIENACADWKNSIKNKDYRANNYFYKYCRDYQ